MYRNIFILALAVSIFSCQNSDRNKETQSKLNATIEEGLKEIAEEQAGAIDGESIVKVNSAFYYGEPIEEDGEVFSPLALDISFINYNSGLDLDDVEIVDASEDISYGYDYDAFLLTKDGTINQNYAAWDSISNTFRTLLLFYIPTNLEKIRVFYWGSELTDTAIEINKKTELPYPENSALTGVEEWNYPEGGRFYGELLQKKSYVFGNLSGEQQLMTLDLNQWPPTPITQDVFFNSSVNLMSNGTWVFTSRHPETRNSSIWTSATIKTLKPNYNIHKEKEIRTSFISNGEIFAYTKKEIFRLNNSKLVSVSIKSTDKDVSDLSGIIDIPNDESAVIWNGDIFKYDGNAFTKVLDANLEGYLMNSVANERGTYFSTVDAVYHINPEINKIEKVDQLQGALSMHKGPNESIIFTVGNNAKSNVCGIYSPKDNTVDYINVKDISNKITTSDISDIAFSEMHNKLYIFGRTAFYTVPLSSLD